MTGIRRVGNFIGQALPAAAKRASQGIGAPASRASPQFESIAGRAPQASSTMQAPRLSLSSAQSKLSKMFASPTSPSPSSWPQTGQPLVRVPGSRSELAPRHGLQINGNQTSLQGTNKSRGLVPPEMLGGNIPPEVFHGDKRPPDVIFNQGLLPKDPGQAVNIDTLYKYTSTNKPSPYVSTSKFEEIASGFARPNGYTYTVIPPKDHSIDVNHALNNAGLPSLLHNEEEVAIAGGVPGPAIKKAVDYATGEVIRNPGFEGLHSPPSSPTGSSSSWDFDFPSVPTHPAGKASGQN